MIIIEATVEGMRSRKDNTWGLSIGTQELTPAQEAELLKIKNKLVFLAVKIADFTPKEKKIIDEAKPDFEQKSHSQRLRNVLFVWWQQNPQGYLEFDSFYYHWMESFIDKVKLKLDK